jgi:hypothetical protein
MNRHHSLLASAAFALTAVSTPASAAQLIQNGGFTAGLTGWTSFTTANGSNVGTGVRTFDVTGTGAQSALFLNVGILNPPFFGSQQGGGVSQTFVSGAGTATFSASIAAFSRTGNLAAGAFSVLLDGVTLATIDFGKIASLGTERDTLRFTGSLTAGTHMLSLLATRPFAAAGGDVTNQYITNVSLDGVAAVVPEPATWSMMMLGFGLTAATLRYRRRTTVARVAV